MLRLAVLLAAAAALALGALVPWTRTALIVGLSYALAALGVSIMVRAGQISFGHALYAAVAGYGVAFIGRAWPAADGLLLLVLGTAAATLAGALVGVFVVRYRGIFFGMLNLAISMVAYSLLGKLYGITGGTDGLRIARPTLAGIALERGPFEIALLVATVVACVALGALVQRYFASAGGEALAGVKTNETRLEYLGLSARRLLWHGYVLSAAIVGFSGALFALVQGLVTPDLGSWLRSGEFVFITVLGGAQHAVGAFIGAAVFEVVKLVAAASMAGVWQGLLGLTLIVTLLVAPDGIVGLFQRRRLPSSSITVAPASDDSTPRSATEKKPWNRSYARKA